MILALAGGAHPVINISWYEAIAYCNWLSLQYGLTAVYNYGETPDDPNKLHGKILNWEEITNWGNSGFRLPTEAEWEFAGSMKAEKDFLGREIIKKCRFGNGKDVASSDEMNFDASSLYNDEAKRIGWMKDDDPNRYMASTAPVKTYASKNENMFGLHDMSGNISEWCWDFFSENYYAQIARYDKELKESGRIINPLGPMKGNYRVVRGGSWGVNVFQCRTSFRYKGDPIVRDDFIGFRIAQGKL